MRVCIYCLEKKDDALFNAEHVIPQSFGKFADNLTLDCVCADCNDFGAELDQTFARDSVEGFDRFNKGIKSTATYEGLGNATEGANAPVATLGFGLLDWFGNITPASCF